MGTITDKLQYTKDNIDAIYAAVISLGGNITQSSALELIAPAILDLPKVQISQTAFSVSGTAGTINFKVASNRDFILTTTSTGVSINGQGQTATYAAGVYDVPVTYGANGSTIRHRLIHLKISGNTAGTIDITQAARTGVAMAVTGIVYDEMGDPLPDCGVLVVDTSKYTQTGADGKYTLTSFVGIPEYTQLEFSLIGFLRQRKIVPNAGANTINVTMVVDKG